MKTKKLVHLAILITFALVIHTVENAIPALPVPGAKLGLANVITLLTFVLYDFGSALAVAAVRTVLGSIFAGNFLSTGFYLSFSGAIVSTLAMAVGMVLRRREKISLVAVSIMGAAAHNTTQVVVAALFLASPSLVKVYLPLLLLLALPTGLFTGLAVSYTNKALSKINLLRD